jgi:hypothetical protein
VNEPPENPRAKGGARRSPRAAIIDAALDEIKTPAPLLVALAVLLPAANWLLVSMSFWLLTRRYGRVGLPEMAGLVGAAWLLNYIPLRPGFFGRLAYHKRVNHIALKDSAKVLVIAILQTLAAASLLLLAALVFEPRDAALPWIATIMIPLVLVFFVSLMAPHGGTLAGASGLVRVLDMLVWTARYWVAFRLLGQEISPVAALIFAGVSQVALLIPLTGNGLGAREWGIGLAARWMPGGVSSLSGAMAVGLAADLVNRAAEIAASMPVGLCCSAYVARRLARAHHAPG